MSTETQQIPQKTLRYRIYHMIDRDEDAVFRFKYQWGPFWRWGKEMWACYDNSGWSIVEKTSHDEIMEIIKSHAKDRHREAFEKAIPHRRIVKIEEITQ